MARKLLLILCIFLVVPLFSGCGESLKFWKRKKEAQVVNKKLPPFEELFNRTVEMYNSKEYKDAINSLLFLRENYPQKVAYQSRITLYLADSHFHQKEYPEAIANYEEFIKLYPTSPDTPYAYFQIGMSNYKQKRTYDRDATFVRKALKNFKKVLEISPPGILVNESIRMIALCKRELAMHDLFVADFYLRTHHYKPAILCYKDVLRTYPNIKVRDRAHLGIAKAYLKLKKKNDAFRHLSYVARNYPSSPYGKNAWKILQKKFKVASIDQLPMVTFPERKPVKKAMPEMLKKNEGKTKGQKVATGKAIHEVPAKPLVKTASKHEPELKPHVYFPKVTSVQEKPSVYYPPVKTTVEKHPSPQVAKASVSPKEVKSEEEKKQAKQHKAGKVEAIERSSTKPAVHPTIKVKELQTVEKAPAKVAKKVAKAPAQGIEKAARKGPEAEKNPTKVREIKQKEKVAGAQEAAPPGKSGRAALKKKKGQVEKVKKTPATVKKMVKTDKLPPKGEKETSSGLVGALDTRQPIHITSDHVEAKQGKDSVRFYGNVEAKQKDVILKSDDLTAFYTKGGKAIDKIIAHGNVSIKQRNKKVVCGKAIFYNAKRWIVLEDSPTAWDGNNKISGGKMILLLEKNEIQILGTKKKPTELIIYPEKKPDLLKSPK